MCKVPESLTPSHDAADQVELPHWTNVGSSNYEVVALAKLEEVQHLLDGLLRYPKELCSDSSADGLVYLEIKLAAREYIERRVSGEARSNLLDLLEE